LPTTRPPLLVPVESQVRELDAKLLLSLVAAERGFSVTLGPRATLHLEATSLPRGVYLAKSVRSLSVRMFRIYRDLGSQIAAWDEEALVRNPSPSFWYQRRLSKEAIDRVRVFFAWGPDDAEAIRAFPGWPGTDIHATGNPRIDLMRPELRGYFEEDVADLRRRFGDFLLVNTNFALANHYVARMTGVLPLTAGSHSPEHLEIAQGLVAHRRAIFQHFKGMVASLAEANPQLLVVVRPHPVENHAPWNEIAAAHPNVRTVHEGSVLPWLLASKLLIHNNCTTGVEAYALGVPAVAYQPVTSERFDNDLANALSARAFDLDQLHARVASILAHGPEPETEDRRKRVRRHLASLEGPLASDRIVDVLAELYPPGVGLEKPKLTRFARAWLHSELRAAIKRTKSRIPGNRNSADYQRHRFPGVTLETLRARATRMGALLGRFEGVELYQRAEAIFEIRPARPRKATGEPLSARAGNTRVRSILEGKSNERVRNGL
jgi:surface carbohydrate biosynthesis protein